MWPEPCTVGGINQAPCLLFELWCTWPGRKRKPQTKFTRVFFYAGWSRSIFPHLLVANTDLRPPGFPLALLEGAKTTQPINPQTCTKTLRQESGNKNMCSAIYTQNATAFVCPAAYFLISLSGSFIRLWFNRTTPNACPKAQTDLLVVIFFQVCITKIWKKTRNQTFPRRCCVSATLPFPAIFRTAHAPSPWAPKFCLFFLFLQCRAKNKCFSHTGHFPRKPWGLTQNDLGKTGCGFPFRSSLSLSCLIWGFLRPLRVLLSCPGVLASPPLYCCLFGFLGCPVPSYLPTCVYIYISPGSFPISFLDTNNAHCIGYLNSGYLNHIHKKRVERLKVRSNEAYFCQFGLIHCRS